MVYVRIRMELSSILILLTSCLQTCMTYTIPVCIVKNSWWLTEELYETCRVSFQNKFEKLVHLVGFIVRIYDYARSHERKMLSYCFQGAVIGLTSIIQVMLGKISWMLKCYFVLWKTWSHQTVGNWVSPSGQTVRRQTSIKFMMTAWPPDLKWQSTPCDPQGR
jgi:hypothetical protein